MSAKEEIKDSCCNTEGLTKSTGKQDKGVVHDTIVLTIITLVAGLVLGGVHHITAAPIAAQEKATMEAAQRAVFADADSFDEVPLDDAAMEKALADNGLTRTTVNAVYAAKDSSGTDLGYVVDSTNSEGYGGDVEVMVGITTGDSGYTVNGISFLSLSETAGMGMKAKNPEFMDQFTDMALGDSRQIAYTKNGKSAANEIDAISGATVTTNAVTKAVNGALAAVSTVEEGAS
ncbi:MAG: RnfABCDGE type electron transport complex subunit G [Lachnospiraceae bacterium]|nr:RnfABCDGE type electron transport complex subunit G [Lachnospiraceae bacterium]